MKSAIPARSFLTMVAVTLAAAAATAVADTVRITPLGSHDGEFCLFDRAMLLEDPDGTRLLYDAGRTVAGGDDPRLGDVDAVLVSHMHGDHVGDKHIPEVNAGECGKPDVSVSSVPNTNSVNIALAKDAQMVTGSDMAQFFGAKLKSLGGDASASKLVRFGASHQIGGVSIATVPAVHTNGINPAFIDGKLGELLDGTGLQIAAGPATGYVVTFSNGLSVYLSGDTGITAEQEVVVRRHYNAKVVVMNIGDTYTTGPAEAAYVVNELIKPASVIASHANEPATKDGKVISGTKTQTFVGAADVPVHLPLSGRTLEFNAGGECVAGC